MSHATALRPRNLAWLPAAFLVVAALVAAAGYGGTPKSFGASTGTSTVTATVAKEVHMALDTGGQCGAGTASATTITGTTLNTFDANVSLASCKVTFGSNNSALGANLLLESGRTAGTHSFCIVALPGSCDASGSKFLDIAAPEAPATFNGGETATAGKFGVKANITGGTCAGGMGASANYFGLGQNTDATPNGATVCSTSSTTDGDVTIDFRANPGSSQPASTGYIVQASFAVTAI